MEKKEYLFQIQYDEISIDNFMNRYHFDEKDRLLVETMARFLTEIIKAKVTIAFADDKVICAASLGEQYDQLENVVMESEHLLMSFCMECFGMELLSKVYEKINEAVHGETGKWLSVYHFLGENDIETLLQTEVFSNVCWKNGMLHPLKSVVFEAGYQLEKNKSGCHNCGECQNYNCSFRERLYKNKSFEIKKKLSQVQPKYSYGIAQILSNREI